MSVRCSVVGSEAMGILCRPVLQIWEKGKGCVNRNVTEDKRVNGFKPGRQEGTAV